MNTDPASCFSDSNYQLIDFGGGEKLERFADTIVQRQTPSANGQRENLEVWNSAHICCKISERSRVWSGESEKVWRARFGGLVFRLKPTPTGQVGVFPEQATNWSWIQETESIEGCRALNLFGYTGGTTMALAARGAEVVHCDAAKSVVTWAKANAEESNLAEASIRWIVEDAMRFVNREIKRGNKYDIVIADPPSFGRGPKGESWKIQRDFAELLEGLKELTNGQPRMMVISCHTPEYDEQTLCGLVAKHFGRIASRSECFTLAIPAANGRVLNSGCCFRTRS